MENEKKNLFKFKKTKFKDLFIIKKHLNLLDSGGFSMVDIYFILIIFNHDDGFACQDRGPKTKFKFKFKSRLKIINIIIIYL